ncbi:MAG: nucleotidyltransferase substrate binding protein [Caldimicrobium sp.]|nr:nucleotidyltransferase substrate binding protein [Caldimicrobium sp.]MCX7873468.1 nucleotidyltransferase substrate binding protein [Caldimicrobium sp.]MDW8182810.1 nucleotidyltransferase substrate binding protein [Caldimicrobium sp.]
MAHRQRLVEKLEDFNKTLSRLSEIRALALPQEILFELSTKRSEYNFKVFCKLVKILLETKGILCYSPLDCFKNLYQMSLIEETQYKALIKFTKIKNTIEHIYDFSTAEGVYRYIIDEAIDLVENVKEKLVGHIKKAEVEGYA